MSNVISFSDRGDDELKKLKAEIQRRISTGEVSSSEAIRILDQKRNEIQAKRISGEISTGFDEIRNSDGVVIYRRESRINRQLN